MHRHCEVDAAIDAPLHRLRPRRCQDHREAALLNASSSSFPMEVALRRHPDRLVAGRLPRRTEGGGAVPRASDRRSREEDGSMARGRGRKSRRIREFDPHRAGARFQEREDLVDPCIVERLSAGSPVSGPALAFLEFISDPARVGTSGRRPDSRASRGAPRSSRARLRSSPSSGANV